MPCPWPPERWRVSGKPVLELDGVAVAGGGGPPRLQDVTWRVREGEHWAILGANGAGKSTLLDVVAGKVPVAQGSVAVLGSTARRCRACATPRPHLGVIDATPQPFARGMRPVDVVLNGVAGSVAGQGRRASAHERDRALELLGTLGCAALLDRRFEDCSRGERQRVLVARALIRRATHPDVRRADDRARSPRPRDVPGGRRRSRARPARPGDGDRHPPRRGAARLDDARAPAAWRPGDRAGRRDADAERAPRSRRASASPSPFGDPVAAGSLARAKQASRRGPSCL